LAYSALKSLKYYSLSENAFYCAPKEKKVILKPDRNSELIQLLTQNIQLRNEVIWIEGSYGKVYGFTEEQYNSAMNKAVDKLQEMGILQNKVYVKLRPGDEDPNNNKLVKLLKSKACETIVLPNNIVIEALFIVSEDCSVIGALSSALEFAHIYGHKAYSFFSLFENPHPSFYDRIGGYWENVKKKI
jgi:hypothetical protein